MPRRCSRFALAALFIFSICPLTYAEAPPPDGFSSWSQWEQTCVSDGGHVERVHDISCRCPDGSLPPGHTLHPGLCGGASGTDANTDAGLTPQQQVLITGAYALGQSLHNALVGGPQQDVIDAEQAKRQAAYDAELKIQLEAARQRIMGQMKGDAPGEVTLTYKDSDSSIPSANMSLPPRPEEGYTNCSRDSADAQSASPSLTFKTDDDNGSATTACSQKSGLGFDTAGKMMGASLPPKPPIGVTPTKTDAILKLKSQLLQNEQEEKRLNDLMTQYQQSPDPDPKVVQQLQDKINENETEKKKITLDLSVTDSDDDPVTPTPPAPTTPPTRN